MIVGLLLCDHVDDRFFGIAGDYGDMFEALLGSDVTLKPFDVVRGVLPPVPAACDAWLITGSRRSVYEDEPWIQSLAGFVRDVHAAAVPCVGVCFGHQMIGHALGGSVARATGGWGTGNHRATVDHPAPWMAPAAASFDLLYMHQDQVVSLPPGAVAIAHTDHCPIAMMQVGPAIVGVQGHPEFPVAYLRALLEDRVERIGTEKTDAALASLDGLPDTALVAAWMLDVLRGAK